MTRVRAARSPKVAARADNRLAEALERQRGEPGPHDQAGHVPEGDLLGGGPAAGRRLQGVIESAFAEIEQGWREQVGAERWAAFRETLARIGGDPGDPSAPPP